MQTIMTELSAKSSHHATRQISRSGQNILNFHQLESVDFEYQHLSRCDLSHGASLWPRDKWSPSTHKRLDPISKISLLFLFLFANHRLHQRRRHCVGVANRTGQPWHRPSGSIGSRSSLKHGPCRGRSPGPWDMHLRHHHAGAPPLEGCHHLDWIAQAVPWEFSLPYWLHSLRAKSLTRLNSCDTGLFVCAWRCPRRIGA